MRKSHRLSQLLEQGQGPLQRLLLRGEKLQALALRIGKLLPDEMRGHWQLVNLRGEELILQAENTAWATRLRYLQNHLLEQLRDDGLTRLQRIRIRIAPALPVPSAPRRASMSADAAAVIGAAAESLEDPKLRAALQRLAGRHSSRRD